MIELLFLVASIILWLLLPFLLINKAKQDSIKHDNWVKEYHTPSDWYIKSKETITEELIRLQKESQQ